jgi:hypothetical protein
VSGREGVEVIVGGREGVEVIVSEWVSGREGGREGGCTSSRASFFGALFDSL